MNDDLIITPAEELKGLIALMQAKQLIHSQAEIILNSRVEEYVRMRDYCDLMGVNGTIRDIMLGQIKDVGLSRSVAKEDLLLRLNMLSQSTEKVEYVDMPPDEINTDDVVEDIDADGTDKV